MKLAQKRFKPCLGPGACLLAGFLLIGCGSLKYSADPVNPAAPYVFPGQATAGQHPPPAPSATPGQNLVPVGVPTVSPGESLSVSSMLRSGDTIMISFSDLQPPGLLPVTMELGADGKVTLPFNIIVQATGKTTRQLEQEIRAEYVPKYFKYLTVTVRPEMRFFHVNGEVKVPAAVPYRSDTSVVRAIGAAGGFTDFARRSKILLTRSSGEKQMIDYDKALKDPRKDLPVYPGDHIHVPRRGF